MKKYILLILVFCSVEAVAQLNTNPQDEFTYEYVTLDYTSLEDSGALTGELSSPANLQEATATGATSGTLNLQGQLNVSPSGALIYTIPLELPQGINGVAPELALEYNSQGGNGMAGYGWNVTGLSSITRVPTTQYHDGFMDPVDFDTHDRFALDGQRLVLKSGTYGTDGAVYQTERYSNIRITSYGVSPYGSQYGPEYFKVQYPDGSFAMYGLDANSRSMTEYAITYWENPQGLQITYNYYQEYNTLRISNINYGSNTVHFTYKTRGFFEKAYIGGQEFNQGSILDRISIYVNDVFLKKYQLVHDQNYLGYDRLTALDGTGKSRKYFTYADGSLPATRSSITATLGIDHVNQDNAQAVSMDLTGNGEMDFVLYPNTKDKFWVFENLDDATLNLSYQVNSGQFQGIFPTRWLNDQNKILSGEGLTVVQNSGAKDVKFKVYGRGSTLPLGLYYEKVWSPPTYTRRTSCSVDPEILRIPLEYLSGDFNGDGLTDVLAVSKSYSNTFCYEPDPSENLCPTVTNPITSIEEPDPDCCICNTYTAGSRQVFLINLDRRISASQESSGHMDAAFEVGDKIYTGDFNGDGKTNLLHFKNGSVYVYGFDSSGNFKLLWQTDQEDLKTEFPLLLGDFNGDNKMDFFIPTAVGSNKFRYFLSTGEGFQLKYVTNFFIYDLNVWDPEQGALHGRNLITTDTNGDGKTDILLYESTTYNDGKNGEQRVRTYFNDGNLGFGYNDGEDGLLWKGDLAHLPIPIFLSSDRYNGGSDFATISNDKITKFNFKRSNKEAMLLRSVYDLNGPVYNIHYNDISTTERSIDNIPAYYRNNTQSYPDVDLNVALGSKVVTALERSSGSSPTTKQLFSYYGAIYNLEGRGFRGFQKVASSNWHTGYADRIFSVSQYDLDLRGALIEQYTVAHNFDFSNTPSDYIIKTTNTYTYTQAPNKSFAVNLTSSLQQNSLEGTAITTSYLYDAYNNPTRTTTNYSGDGSSVVEITYDNSSGTPYYIGRPLTEKQTLTLGSETFTTEKQYGYSGYLLTQVKTKGNATAFNTQSFQYDAYGNLIKEINTPFNETPREVRYEYDPSGEFLIKSYDTEGLATSYEYNPSGTLKKLTDPFGKTTQYTYDYGNRIALVKDYLGNNIDKVYTNYNRETLTHYQRGGSSTEVFDEFERLVKQGKQDLSGNWVYISFEYDALGRPWRVSEPYKGAVPFQWNTTEYDFYGRPIKKILSNGQIIDISYHGLSTTQNDGTKTVTTTENALGLTTEVTDPGGTIKYTYYANGQLKSVDLAGTLTHIEQDGWGRRTKLTDPSAGVFRYEYNGFGELTKEIGPKGTTSNSYDIFGKLMEKKVVGDHTNSVTTYSYDPTTKLVNNIDFWEPDKNRRISYNYTYDQYQRLIEQQEIGTAGDARNFKKTFTYDSFGRVHTNRLYAAHSTSGKSGSITVRYTYKEGLPWQLLDDTTGNIIWQTDTQDARGNVLTASFGNTIKVDNTYDGFGFPQQLKHTRDDTSGNSVTVMTLGYDFNVQKGRLNSRSNSLFDWNETFTYDNMDRLTGFTDNNGSQTQTYDARGRITGNSNWGQFSFDNNSKPYQATGLAPTAISQTHYTDYFKQQITYNAFKAPVSIEDSGIDKIYYDYNVNQQRSTMYYGSPDNDYTLRPKRRYYSWDGVMEMDYNVQTGQTLFYLYVGGGPYSAPAVLKSDGDTSELLYLHRDYLGSILAISNQSGQLVEKRHFDAWGKVVKVQDGNGNDLEKLTVLERGYTGHEHLQSVQLIHMNGRLYDPRLRRFLAPDNYIENAYDTQNFNRYAYVLNNPLRYTDPSGESRCCEHLGFSMPMFGSPLGFISSIYSAWLGIAGFMDSFLNPGGAYQNGMSLGPSGFYFGSKKIASEKPIKGKRLNLGVPTGISGPGVGSWIDRHSIAYTAGALKGVKSTVKFLKSLTTREGLRNLGQGFLNMAKMGNPYSIEGRMMRTQTALSVEKTVRHIPEMSSEELFFGAGYMAEKTIETVVLTRGAGWAVNSVRSGIGVAARTGMSEVQLVTRAAQKAEAAIGGTGRFAGTAKHTYANNLLSRYQSIYGNRGLQFNNYFNNGVGNRGFLDVVNHGSKTIYDFKFGSATWRSGQLLKYQRNFPGYNIQIIKP